MSMHDYLESLREYEAVLELAPEAGGSFPEIAWGDHFFYYAPDGQIPQRDQPFATFVTKDYPDDALSRLDAPGRWRLNIHVGSDRFIDLTGEQPRLGSDGAAPGAHRAWDYAVTDTVIPHPMYRAQGWIAVVNPSSASQAAIADLISQAHTDAKRRWHRIR